jgi:hypothetical protein
MSGKIKTAFVANLITNGKIPLYLRISRVATAKDMLRRQFVVKYETPELMEYYYSLGVMDILWSSQLQLTPHKVVKFSNIT